MSCMTWWNRVWRRLHPGKQLASVGLGWKWIQILGFIFSDWLIEFHTLHFTVQDFFFPVSLRTYEVSVQFPLCLVLSSVTATLFGGHTPRLFASFLWKAHQFCKLWGLWDWCCSIRFLQPGLTNVWRKENWFSSDLSASIFPHSWNQMMGCGAVVQGTAFEKCCH